MGRKGVFVRIANWRGEVFTWRQKARQIQSAVRCCQARRPAKGRVFDGSAVLGRAVFLEELFMEDRATARREKRGIKGYASGN